MDRLPSDMVKIIAAHAGFFDRAKIAVCSKQLSQACATVKSDVLVIIQMGGAETYAGDGALWRRCADAPSVLNEGHHALNVGGKMWRIRLKGLSHTPAIESFDLRRNMWQSVGWIDALTDRRDYGCCVLDDCLVFVGGVTGRYREQTLVTFSDVIKLDLETGAGEMMAPLPEPRGDPVCGVCDGRLFVLGGFCSDPLEMDDPRFREEHATVRVLEQRDGQEDVWSAFTTLPPALCRQGGFGAPFRQQHTVFRDHRIFVIGTAREDEADDWDVRILDVRTKTWSTLDVTTSPHWRLRNFIPDSFDAIMPRSRHRCLGTEFTRGGPETRLGPGHMHAIDYRGDIAVFDAGSDDDEDLDRPGVHVLSGDTWLPTGGRLGFTTSRDLPEWAKSKYEVDEVTVAAPSSWLAAMPDCLSMPDLSDESHGEVDLRGQPWHSICRMSLVVSERACVIKA